MRSTAINLLVAAVLVVGIGGFVLAQKNAAVTGMPGAGTESSTVGAPLDSVTAHSSRESCWTIINGSTYDLTSWIPQHPGGEEAILRLCGTDGSAAFNGKHGGAARQENILAGFKIGTAGGGAGAAAGAVTQPSAPAGDDDGDGDDHGRNRRGSDDR
jgi:hypothetical protein